MSNNGGGGPTYGFISPEYDSRAADKLVNTSVDVEEFLTLTVFKDVDEARCFCRSIIKAKRYKQSYFVTYFRCVAQAQPSVKGKRADEFLQGITGVLRVQAKETLKGKDARQQETTRETPAV